jgi:protein-serine/threonine kinase
MKRDIVQMQLHQAQKEYPRARWHRNEANYLREVQERRQKIDVSAFVKQKTIGHGWISSRPKWFSIYLND